MGTNGVIVDEFDKVDTSHSLLRKYKRVYP